MLRHGIFAGGLLTSLDSFLTLDPGGLVDCRCPVPRCGSASVRPRRETFTDAAIPSGTAICLGISGD